jgi:SAM-dependent methyltransferase
VPVNFQSMFVHPLQDLGAAEDPAFRGVLSPQPEVGSKREGVNDAFLGQAEDYYKKYQGFDYWRSLISAAAQRVGADDPRLIVEFGCGFGNSTLPMLDLFPNASIVATDISPNLLSILHRLLESRGLTDRCIAVAMDAHKPYIVPGIADFVLGSAILHHLSEPGDFVAEAMPVLKLARRWSLKRAAAAGAAADQLSNLPATSPRCSNRRSCDGCGIGATSTTNGHFRDRFFRVSPTRRIRN